METQKTYVRTKASTGTSKPPEKRRPQTASTRKKKVAEREAATSGLQVQMVENAERDETQIERGATGGEISGEEDGETNTRGESNEEQSDEVPGEEDGVETNAKVRGRVKPRKKRVGGGSGRANIQKGGRKGNKQCMELGPIPGGPVDQTLLRSFREHVAYAIWEGNERAPLKLQHHWQQMHKWNLKDASDGMKEKLKNSGLLELSEGCLKMVDTTMISAMVERWHPETNTFHLPFGEMTITLDDVAHILRIPVNGDPIYADISSFTVADAEDLLVKGFGISKEEASEELNQTISVRTSTIREWFEEKTNLVGEEEANERDDREVRAYLLYVLGCSVFGDKTGTDVSVIYLKHLMDVQNIHKYSWGSAVLAHLYHQLGDASKAKKYSMTGCFTLLQVWLHEHLKFGNYVPYLKYVESQPLTRKWLGRSCSGNKDSVLRVMREQLDTISLSDVVWNPYKDMETLHPCREINWYRGWLVCIDIEEPIYPDRVTRQFGRIQKIPELPVRSVDEPPKYDLFINWTSHVIPEEMRGEPISLPWDCVKDYFSWYQKITHRLIRSTNDGIQQYEEFFGPPRSLIEELQRAKDLCRTQPIEIELKGCIDRAFVLAKRQESEGGREETRESERDAELSPQRNASAAGMQTRTQTRNQPRTRFGKKRRKGF